MVFNRFGADVTPKHLEDENFATTVAGKSVGEMSKEEEMAWFRSKVHRERTDSEIETIRRKKAEEKLKQKASRAPKRVQILRVADLEKHTTIPDVLFLRLNETETIWLLSINTSFSHANPEDTAKVKAENERYEQLTSEKGLCRKRLSAETQTVNRAEKSKGTITAEIHVKDAFVNASAWDLFDTYTQTDGETKQEGVLGIKEFEMLMDTTLKFKGIGAGQISKSALLPADVQAKRLLHIPEYHYALLITERLLASSNYQEQQAIFREHPRSRYQEVEPSQFSYEMNELWVFDKGAEKPMAVSCMDWNPQNPNLLTVGYGSYCFGRGHKGVVCVWSAKNPDHPEKEFQLPQPVTALSHSSVRPNILAVGCRNGDVYIVDVSTDGGKQRILGRDKIHYRHGPVWKMRWMIRKGFENKRDEELLAVGEGGVLIRFTFPDDDATKDILKLEYSATTIEIKPPKKVKRGALQAEPHLSVETCSIKHLSGLSFSLVSNGNVCYVATKEGVVVKCIVRKPCKMAAVLPAHDGAVFTIEHSPFSDLIYFTCGSDWKLRIWMEGLSEPLVTLATMSPIICAQWSPTISTVIASVNGTELSLWDIARTANSPSRLMTFPNQKVNFSTLLFSRGGTNIVIGDHSGVVRTLHLSEMPRQPFLQIEALVSAIERALFTKPELLKMFKKTVDAHKENFKTKIVI